MLRRLPSRTLAALSAALLLATLPHAFAQKQQHHEHKRNERSQIIGLEHEWRSAVLSDDVHAMDHLLSEDYLGITANGEVLTKPQQLDRMHDGQLRISRLDISETKIKLIGHIAIVTCLADVEGINDGDALHGAYRYTRVYQRMPNGNWKVTSFEVTPAARVHTLNDAKQ
ncbi:MAG: nuclear transport factor 2 family protein [Acidobacteriaceae bacterium]